ncbi:MAG: HpnA protein [Planctomycetaceae bacterium]|nr:HpnA protein [Planctomycetaceae bacterium]
MTTLVTGATGLVGNNVVRLLLERGEAVRVLARETSDSRPLEGLDVEVARGDVRDGDSVREAAEGIDRVVHSAAVIHIGWTGLKTQREVNVEGTRNVAIAATAAGAKMVHVSSVDALGVGSRDEPANEYPPFEGKILCTYVITKREAEAVLLEQVERGLDATIVNPGLMFGPWDWKPSSGRMMLEVARRFTPLAPKGGCTVCDVRDVAAGIVSALDSGQTGRRYILGGSHLTYFDMWKLFATVSRGKAPIGRAGPLMRIAAGCFGDAITMITGREPDVNSAAIGMSNLYHYYSSARAEQELGYTTRDLEGTVKDAWAWFQANGYA